MDKQRLEKGKNLLNSIKDFTDFLEQAEKEGAFAIKILETPPFQHGFITIWDNENIYNPILDLIKDYKIKLEKDFEDL